MNNTLEQVQEFLETQCIGKRNAVKSRQLEQLFSIHGTVLRSIINSLRSNGYPICSGKEGYWYAESVEEAEATRKQLETRMIGIENAVQGLSRFISTERETQVRTTYRQLTIEDILS